MQDNLLSDLTRDLSERDCLLALRGANDDRLAVVGGFSSGNLQRQMPEERDPIMGEGVRSATGQKTQPSQNRQESYRPPRRGEHNR